MDLLGAQEASTAKRVRGQTDKQGQRWGVSCLASSCHHPNACSKRDGKHTQVHCGGQNGECKGKHRTFNT